MKAFGYRDGNLSGRVAVVPTGVLTEEDRSGLSDFFSLSFGELEGPQARSYSFGEGFGGGGGNVGGGGGTPPGGNTPPASKIARVELEKSVKIAVDSMLKKMGEAAAACNYGVQVVFNRHFNTRELNNKRANDMVDHWEAHPEKW